MSNRQADARDRGLWNGVAYWVTFSCVGLQVALLTPLYLLSNQPAAYDTDVFVVLARGGALAGVAASVATAICLLLPAVVARGVLRGALIVALLLALEHSFLYYLSPFGELDGSVIAWRDMKLRAAIDLGIWIATAGLALRVSSGRGAKTLGAASFLILLLATAQAAPTLIENGSRIVPKPQPPYHSFFELSPDENIIFYVADTISLDAARGVLDANPRLAEHFEGFTFYTDTLSAGNTAPSSYGILTGSALDLTRAPDIGLYRMDIATHGFPRHLSSAGYDLSYVAVSDAHCAGLHSLCAVRNIAGSFPKSLLGERYAAYRDYLLLVDVALFRHAPLVARGTVYNGGNWRISRLFGSGIEPSGVGLALRELIDNLEIVQGAPRFKWYHSQGAHPPWLYDQGCARLDNSLNSNEAYRAQVHCVLREFALLIQALKDRELYDNTALFFVADHGIGRPMSNPLNFPEADRSIPWAENRAMTERAVDRFRPMVMIKPFDQRGALAFSRAQIHQVNLAPTVLAVAGIESPYRETAITEIREDERRSRRLLREFGRTRKDEAIDFDEYVVRGPSNDYRSYRKLQVR